MSNNYLYLFKYKEQNKPGLFDLGLWLKIYRYRFHF